MGTDMTKGALKTFTKEQLLAGLSTTKEESKTQNHNYMQYSGKEGKLLVQNGTDDPDEFDMDETLILSLLDTRKGYVCWKESKVVDHDDDYSLFEALPPIDSLEDHGPFEDKRDGWVMQYSLFMKSTVDGKQYVLKLSSASSTRQFGTFIEELIEELAVHDPITESPVIQFSSSAFKAKGYKNYKPVIKIVEWRDNPKLVEAPKVSGALEDHSGTEAVSASRKAKK